MHKTHRIHVQSRQIHSQVSKYAALGSLRFFLARYGSESSYRESYRQIFYRATGFRPLRKFYGRIYGRNSNSVLTVLSFLFLRSESFCAFELLLLLQLS
jgi:hypothetical protein